jgi:hypothetical protein
MLNSLPKSYSTAFLFPQSHSTARSMSLESLSPHQIRSSMNSSCSSSGATTFPRSLPSNRSDCFTALLHSRSVLSRVTCGLTRAISSFTNSVASMGVSPKIVMSDSPLGEIIRLNTEGDEPPERLKRLKLLRTETAEWGATDKESAELYRLAKLLSQMTERQRTLLLRLAQGMASRTKATTTAAR